MFEGRENEREMRVRVKSGACYINDESRNLERMSDSFKFFVSLRSFSHCSTIFLYYNFVLIIRIIRRTEDDANLNRISRLSFLSLKYIKVFFGLGFLYLFFDETFLPF